MDFSIKSGHPEKQRTACVVVGIYEPRKLSDVAKKIDEMSDGYLSSILRRGDLEGKIGQTLILYNVPGTLSDRVMLVGCGRERELGDVQYRKVVAEAIRTLNETGSMETVCYLTELNVRGRGTTWKVRHAIESAYLALYNFDEQKSKKSTTRRPLRKIVFSVSSRRELGVAEQAQRVAQAIAKGIVLAKDLGNTSPNVCTPDYLAEAAKKLCAEHDRLTCKVLNESQIEKTGMNALLAVSKGSKEPPRFIIMEYRGAASRDDKPYVLIGKGVTFDSGGISLKPGLDMDHMKYDMSGGGGVLGAMSAVADLQLPLNVVALIPAVENKPSGSATNPGDIVTSLSGQTIEILNTDAEGRLILCDAMTYAEQFEPVAVIDVATLTGACVTALGRVANGLMSNHNPLTNDLLNAGQTSCDRAWELPLWEDYQSLLDSNFADMANIPQRPEAGAIVAACFLSRFAKKYHWAHLDVAGTAYVGGKEKGSTGRPVGLLVQYLLDRSYEITGGDLPDTMEDGSDEREDEEG